MHNHAGELVGRPVAGLPPSALHHYGADSVPPGGYGYGEPQYGYGHGGGLHKPLARARRAPYVLWWRRQLNYLGMVISLFVPWLVFMGTYWACSFGWAFHHPGWSCMAVVFFLLVVIACGYSALHAVKRKRELGPYHYEPGWYLVLFLCSAVAWVLAVWQGRINFYYRMEPFFGLQSMHSYRHVNPSTIPGKRMMDAARVTFATGAHIDIGLSTGFVNDRTYCVAPIVGGDHDTAGGTSDFWAVGIDCCCGQHGLANNFTCGAYRSKGAGGIRLMRDDQRPFYRLAVQQAHGAFGAASQHPLFFHYVEDPVIAVDAYSWEGYRHFLIWIYVVFIVQLVVVVAAAFLFAKCE